MGLRIGYNSWCPQYLLKMLEGLALPERCIIKPYFDAIASQTRWKDKALCHLCSLACGSVTEISRLQDKTLVVLGWMVWMVTRFAWWWQDLHAIELLRAHIGEWTMTRMVDYWWVMCFTGYRLNWNPWIWIPFPIDSDCTLLCAQVDRTRYSSIASGNNCIVQLCKCVSLHL
jgi:hypothetical protein